MVHAAVRLAELGESCGAHPHHEILVQVAVVELPDGARPRRRLQPVASPIGRVRELDVHIGAPCNIRTQQRHRLHRPVGRNVLQSEAVVEQSVRNLWRRDKANKNLRGC